MLQKNSIGVFVKIIRRLGFNFSLLTRKKYRILYDVRQGGNTMIELSKTIKRFKESIYILIISSIFGFTINIFHPDGYIFISKEAFNYKKIVFISSEEANIKLSSPLTVIIDSRDESEYLKSHIPGAINIPGDPESTTILKIKENYNIMSQPNELVIYCTGTSCGTSEILAKRFINIGYSKHIYIIENGFPEWEKLGYPIEKERAS